MSHAQKVRTAGLSTKKWGLHSGLVGLNLCVGQLINWKAR